MKKRFLAFVLCLSMLLSSLNFLRLCGAVADTKIDSDLSLFRESLQGYFLDLPKSIHEIVDYAFYGDTSIEYVNIPFGAVYIGAHAFGNSSVKGIIIPDSVLYIDPTAFDGAEDVTIYASADSFAGQFAISQGIFYQDDTSTVDEDNLEPIYIESGMFEELDLTGITDPDTLTVCEEYNKVMRECQGIATDFNDDAYNFGTMLGDFVDESEIGNIIGDNGRFLTYQVPENLKPQGSVSVDESNTTQHSDEMILRDELGHRYTVTFENGCMAIIPASPGMRSRSVVEQDHNEKGVVEDAAKYMAAIDEIRGLVSSLSDYITILDNAYTGLLGSLNAIKGKLENPSFFMDQILHNKEYLPIIQANIDNVQKSLDKLRKISAAFDKITIESDLEKVLKLYSYLLCMHPIAIDYMNFPGNSIDDKLSSIEVMNDAIRVAATYYIADAGFTWAQTASAVSTQCSVVLTKGLFTKFPMLKNSYTQCLYAFEGVKAIVTGAGISTIMRSIGNKAKTAEETATTIHNMLHSWFVLYGTVTDQDGMPIENATVQYDTWQNTTTNNIGYYQFAVRPDSVIKNIYFTCNDYFSETKTVNSGYLFSDGLCNVDITLISSLMNGKVTDGETGEAIEGATIKYGSVETRSDANGEFVIGVSAGRQLLEFKKPGYFPKSDYRYFEKAKPADYPVTLNPAVLEGFVADSETGGPVKDVVVRCGTETVNTDANGKYRLPVTLGSHTVVFSRTGYFMLYKDCFVENQPGNLLSVEMQPSVVKGKVYDAQTNAPLAGVTVTCGGTSMVTASDGYYSLPLNQGTHYLVFTKDKYTTEKITAAVEPQAEPYNVFMSKTLKENEYRVTLQWGDFPQDLDLHLKYGASLEYEHVFFGNRASTDGLAVLDIDKRDGYGPETITFTIDPMKRYVCFVHDYSHRNTAGSGALTVSNARLKIWNGDSSATILDVPYGAGRYWKAFIIENGEITICNWITDAEPTW